MAERLVIMINFSWFRNLFGRQSKTPPESSGEGQKFSLRAWFGDTSFQLPNLLSSAPLGNQWADYLKHTSTHYISSTFLGTEVMKEAKDVVYEFKQFMICWVRTDVQFWTDSKVSNGVLPSKSRERERKGEKERELVWEPKWERVRGKGKARKREQARKREWKWEQQWETERARIDGECIQWQTPCIRLIAVQTYSSICTEYWHLGRHSWR